MAKKQIHVVQSGDKWRLRGTSNSTSFQTQKKAADKGKSILNATKSGGELVIHSKDGKFSRKHTYNKKDNYPPRG